MSPDGDVPSPSRRTLLASAAVSAASLACRPGRTSRSAPRRPNVVLLLADQWRGSATGYAGDPNAHTPNLDALVRQSVAFRNAVSVCPVCTPYRAALLTGRYPTTTGMFLNDLYLPPSEVCLSEVLTREGYATAYIGKWHLDGHGRDSFIPPERRHGWHYWKAAECDHNYLRSHYYAGASAEKRYWRGYDAYAQTDDAECYLRSRAGDEAPFALMVSFGPPHFPHFPEPPSLEGRRQPGSILLPPNVPEAMRPVAAREAAGYYAHCEAIDACVGRLVRTLRDLGLEEDTILVFTSDHGEMMGSHGCAPTTKQVPWRESVGVPLIVRYPRAQRARPRMVTTPITTPDLLPTLLRLARIDVPTSAEGEDLSRLVRGGEEVHGRAVLYMSVSPFVADPAFRQEYRAIRTERHTYVESLDGPWLLYDDVADPYQLRNLVHERRSVPLRRRLARRLREELHRIRDNFLPRTEYLRRFGYQVTSAGHIAYSPGSPVQTPSRRSP